MGLAVVCTRTIWQASDSGKPDTWYRFRAALSDGLHGDSSQPCGDQALIVLRLAASNYLCVSQGRKDCLWAVNAAGDMLSIHIELRPEAEAVH